MADWLRVFRDAQLYAPSCCANTRRTDVRDTPKCRAIAAWLRPCCARVRIAAASLAVARGRPWAFPRLRASVMPALIRSRIKSRSNSANTARKPAKARPAGVVRSRASVSETKPTPKGDCSRATGFIQLVHDEVRQGFVDGLRLGLHATYPAPAQFIAVCRRSKWSKYFTNSP